MKKTFIISLVISCMVIISAFKIEGETLEYLLAGSSFKQWKLTKETMNGTDITSSRYNNCDLDNLYRFSANRAFLETEGATKCISENPDTIRIGTWGFNEDKTVLKIYSNVDTLSFSINSLTNTQAVGTHTTTTHGVFQNTFIAQ